MLPSLFIKFVHPFFMDSVKTHSQLISGDYRILLNIRISVPDKNWKRRLQGRK